MELHFDQELAQLKDSLLRLSALAEQSVAEALRILIHRYDTPAIAADADDDTLDELQMEIDEACVQLIAKRQPKARDLRFVVMTMKIAAELERIGDQAVNIVDSAEQLKKEPPLKPLLDIPRMAEIAQSMIRETLDAFVFGKPELARQVVLRDDEVDNLNRQLHRELTSFMIEDPKTVTRCLELMTISRSLERIADHATNIAEDVVYLYEARDIRHHTEEVK